MVHRVVIYNRICSIGVVENYPRDCGLALILGPIFKISRGLILTGTGNSFVC